jgi:hypothetical protein
MCLRNVDIRFRHWAVIKDELNEGQPVSLCYTFGKDHIFLRRFILIARNLHGLQIWQVEPEKLLQNIEQKINK